MREIKLRNSVVTVIYFWWEWTSPLPRAQLILSLPWGNSVLHGSKQRHAAHHSQTLWRSFSKNVGCRFGIQVKGKQRKRIFFEERYFFFSLNLKQKTSRSSSPILYHQLLNFMQVPICWDQWLVFHLYTSSYPAIMWGCQEAVTVPSLHCCLQWSATHPVKWVALSPGLNVSTCSFQNLSSS